MTLTKKIILTLLITLTVCNLKAQNNISADTLTNWQIYLGQKEILADYLVSINTNKPKIVTIKKADLVANKKLIIKFHNCTKTTVKNIEIQFGDGNKRYSQNYYSADEIDIKTKLIIELLKYKDSKQIVLSLNNPSFVQPNGRQYGVPLIDIRVED